MDLHGAPYGYTPFCDSRKETDGFRFWKQGWWSGHLQGRPYHIRHAPVPTPRCVTRHHPPPADSHRRGARATPGRGVSEVGLTGGAWP
jgi:hypothetical protein